MNFQTCENNRLSLKLIYILIPTHCTKLLYFTIICIDYCNDNVTDQQQSFLHKDYYTTNASAKQHFFIERDYMYIVKINTQ